MGALFLTTSVRSCLRTGIRSGLTIVAVAAIAWPLMAKPAQARGPEAIADVAEQVIDAVVNISTKQTVDMSKGAMPQLPPGSPFEEFFDEFFKNKGLPGGPNGKAPTPRRVNSLGSGFHHRPVRSGGDQ